MIHFDFDWSDLLNIVTLGFAIAILTLQLWVLFKSRAAGRIDFSGRFVLRLVLNLLLWMGVIGFIIQPYISGKASSQSRILSAPDVPADFTDQLRDSIHAETITADDLRNLSADSLILIGQNFPATLFPGLRQLEGQPVIQWIPYFDKDQLQSLHWKGVLRKGDMQSVYGTIESTQSQIVKIKFGNQTLDSAALKPGLNDFRLQFPVFTQGRTVTELVMGSSTLDTLRFFARPAETMTIHFLLDSPDFETRNLATWFGKNGNAVKYETRLSKDLQVVQNINAAKEPDLIVTDPGNAADASVKKAVNIGRSVLFINLSNPVAEIPAINAALGTKFQIRKISNEETVRITPEMNALPYQFSKSAFQLGLPHYPVVTEKTNGKIGVSLVAETFPMQLTGDSIAYEKVWNEILALVRPGPSGNIAIEAPAYFGLRTQLIANDFKDFKNELKIGRDTIFMQRSELNEKSGSAEFLPVASGWVAFQDSVPAEIYVEGSGLRMKAAEMDDFIHSYYTYRTSLQPANANKGNSENLVTKKLPDWFWFTWLLVCLTALWVEAKF